MKLSGPIEKGIRRPPTDTVEFDPYWGIAVAIPELAEMEVGDSIYIPNAPGRSYPPVGAVRIHAYGNEVLRKYMCRYDDKGMRVWRV